MAHKKVVTQHQHTVVFAGSPEEKLVLTGNRFPVDGLHKAVFPLQVVVQSVLPTSANYYLLTTWLRAQCVCCAGLSTRFIDAAVSCSSITVLCSGLGRMTEPHASPRLMRTSLHGSENQLTVSSIKLIHY